MGQVFGLCDVGGDDLSQQSKARASVTRQVPELAQERKLYVLFCDH